MHHGKEIYNFFGKYEICGIFGIIISSIILGKLINKVFQLIHENNIENYNNFLIFIFKNMGSQEIIIKSINNIINIFLLISFYIMMAGLGAYFKQKYNVEVFITSIIAAFFCYIILNKNIEGVIKISTICVPVIIFFILFVGVKSVDTGISKINYIKFNIKCLFPGIFSSFLYAGYNSILLIPVVISLKKYIKKSNINYIGKSIASILILLGFSVFIVLLIGNYEIMMLDMPIAFIIKNFGKMYEYLYGIVIITSIITSIISAGHSFLKNCSTNNKSYKTILLLICISSIFVSNIGFSELINILYPIFGIIGLVQIIFILNYSSDVHKY